MEGLPSRLPINSFLQQVPLLLDRLSDTHHNAVWQIQSKAQYPEGRLKDGWFSTRKKGNGEWKAQENIIVVDTQFHLIMHDVGTRGCNAIGKNDERRENYLCLYMLQIK